MKNVARLAWLPTLKQREERYIRRVVKLCGGDIVAAARLLGIGRATLYRLVTKLSLETRRQRRERIKLERALRVEGRCAHV